MVLGEESSDDGRPAWEEDRKDENDQTHLSLKFDSVNGVVVLAHSFNKINYNCRDVAPELFELNSNFNHALNS